MSDATKTTEEAKRSRTEKATETRNKKREETRNLLYTTILQTEEAFMDKRYAFDLNLPLPFVRRALFEETRFHDLMRAGKIAVPGRSLKLPTWAEVLTQEEKDRLPRATPEQAVSADLLPVPQTGDESSDRNWAEENEMLIDMARRLSPRRARRVMEDAAIRRGQMIDEGAQMREENRLLRISERDAIRENATLKRTIQRMEGEQKRLTDALADATTRIARLEAIEGPGVPPTSGHQPEQRAHTP